jgi:hypothetical protein
MYGCIPLILLPLGIQTWKVIVWPGVTDMAWIYTVDDPDELPLKFTASD